MRDILLDAPCIAGPPHRLSGRVYGTLLNHRSALEALEGALNLPPYGAAPKAPILYLKPRNTLAANGDEVVVPRDVEELEVGGCLGLVIGRPVCNIPADRALDVIGGYVIVNDVSVPHSTYYRPSIRFKARDGFCPIGPRVVAPSAIADPDVLTIQVFVDGDLRSVASTSDLLRPVAKLLADVTEFMTLSPGDILAVGVAAPVPRVRAGQRVRVEIDGVGTLENPFVTAATVAP
jgi:5-oxopent-3-ene-1,2,5-tricarboxylate decarboxylase/2-hydroxyhepta-2,4-diene-1,7-dioate isomerase